MQQSNCIICICTSSWQPHKQQRDTAAATTTNKRTVYIVGKYSIYCKQKKKSPKFIDIIKKGFIQFSNVLSKRSDVRLIIKSNKKKIIPRIFFDYVPKSSTFDTIFVRKNIPFLSLQRHSEIMQIFFFFVQRSLVWMIGKLVENKYNSLILCQEDTNANFRIKCHNHFAFRLFKTNHVA